MTATPPSKVTRCTHISGQPYRDQIIIGPISFPAAPGKEKKDDPDHHKGPVVHMVMVISKLAPKAGGEKDKRR